MTVKHISIDRINGFERRPSGIYVPTKETLKKTLENAKVPSDEKIKYVPHGNEEQSLEIAKKIHQGVLIAGPTGVGKSMLVRSMAQKWGIPFLWFTCDPDKTEGKLMGRPDMVFASAEIEGKMELLHLQQFRPSSISTAGLSGEPVVLFIDELHKLRKDIDALFHPLINERVVNLSDHLGPGEIYPLHKDTIVIFALNPYYGDGGIERVGQAMRQRVKTLYLPMVVEKSKLIEIVRANVDGFEKHNSVIEKICDMCASLARVYLESRREAVTNANDQQIKSMLKSVMMNLNEAPSPRIIVNTIRAIVSGQNPSEAVLEGIFNSITNDFGQTAASLKTMAHDIHGIGKK